MASFFSFQMIYMVKLSTTLGTWVTYTYCVCLIASVPLHTILCSRAASPSLLGLDPSTKNHAAFWTEPQLCVNVCKPVATQVRSFS